MELQRIDHVVLTVRNIESACDFYSRVLGMEVVTFEGDRKALRFGQCKINLHQAGREFEPKADQPTPGSQDLCLISELTIDEVVERLEQSGVAIIEGPVAQSGATGPMVSVYIRDPDGNLVEIASHSGDVPSNP